MGKVPRVTSRSELLDYAVEQGWVVDEKENKRGYIKVKCVCGRKHMSWVHKTPSNPNYWFEKAKWIARACVEPTSAP